MGGVALLTCTSNLDVLCDTTHAVLSDVATRPRKGEGQERLC